MSKGIWINPMTLKGVLGGAIEMRVGDRVIKYYGNERDAGHYQRGFGDGLRYCQLRAEETLAVMESYEGDETPSARKLERYARQLREAMHGENN